MEFRTRIVITLMAILQLCAWCFSLAGNIGIHFWDPKYALDRVRSMPSFFHDSEAFEVVQESYLTWRYVWFFPHVIGAIVWWNLYFVQLIPSIRQKNKTFHRWMGRFLIIAAVSQVASGTALACTSHSPIIKTVSLPFGVAVAFCIFQAWKYARARDISRHQYWAMRLVGYLQVIAAQRFWLIFLIVTHECGWTFLYPSLDGASQAQIDSVLMGMFDGSFVLAGMTATYVTEWYLSGTEGNLDAPCSEKRKLYTRIDN